MVLRFWQTTIFLLIMFSGFLLQAQEITSTKIDLWTKRQLNSPEFKWDHINLLVKGDKDAVAAVTEQAGGYFKYSYAGISAVRIPVANLEQFLAEDAVIRVENADVPVTLMNDTSKITSHILEVHNGAGSLPSPYKGNGVVVGVIDDGIDLEHEDFKKANGDTRIRFLWDQSINNQSGPYGYGREWTELDINAGNSTHQERTTAFSHGTHVAGTAAGNGNATGKFIGMAPESDLIIVRFDFNRVFLSSILDAVDYVFKKADAMGKPCVINASLGTYFGSRDAKDFAAQLIDALLEETNGRAMVCAAGNAGQHKFHLGYNVTADTSFTWFRFNSNPGAGDIYFQLWSDTADFKDVWFSFGANDPNNAFADLGRIQFLSVDSSYQGVEITGSLIKNFTLNSGINFIGNVSTQLTVSEGRYLYEAIIQPNNSSHLWRFETTGSGRIDVWSSKKLMNTADMVYTGLPDAVTYPNIVYYKEPDTMQSIVSSYNASEKVISVGNYNNRGYYVDVYGDTIRSPFTVGAIYVDNDPVRENNLGSSYGPTRDGRTKPDISAPGTFVISSGNAQFISDAINSGNPANFQKVAEGGKHFRNNGTSMASPSVAGAVALYLEKNPTADWREVKDALLLSAFQDGFTGSVPNNAYGYGKLNALAALETNLIYGCTDATALNYDPLANMDDGSCQAVIMGCTDVVAVNYNPDANMSDNSCVYDTLDLTGINTLDQQVSISVYPNPAHEQFRLFYEFSQAAESAPTVVITNIIGQVVEERSLTGNKGVLVFDRLRMGMYIYRVKTESQILAEGKVILH